MSHVHLTRIYTKTGDTGTTAVGNGSRVPKTHPRIATTGEVDECNAAIGMALALGQLDEEVTSVLTSIQNDLFDLGADLSNPLVENPPHPPLRITDEDITRVEHWCDDFNKRLPRLESFVLPGGTPGAALLHNARTITRRAERHAWTLSEIDEGSVNPLALTYLNRLSDLLFILCRIANSPEKDVTWVPRGSRHSSR